MKKETKNKLLTAFKLPEPPTLLDKEQFKIGEKVRAKIGSVWVNAEIESIDGEYYVCRTSDWSTHFHISQIKKEATK